MSSRTTRVEAAPSDSFDRGASSQLPGPIPTMPANRSHRVSLGAPGGGSVTTYTCSGVRLVVQRVTTRPACCCRQNRRPPWPSVRIDSTYSSQVQVLRFLTTSCHMAGTVRPRSRTPTTIRRSVVSRLSDRIAIFGRAEHGEELHGDHRGPGVVVDLLHQGVPRARLPVVALHEVGDGVDVASPVRSREQHTLLAQLLAVGVEATLQERRTGLHQPDVDHHALRHASPRLVVPVIRSLVGQSASRAHPASSADRVTFVSLTSTGPDILVAASTHHGRTRHAMGRLCQTDGLTDDQTEILKAVRSFVEREILPVATELEHADEYPTEIVEGLKELGHLRADDPRGVRRARRVAADLRPGGRGDRPRLDERQRHHQHPLHRGLHAAPARHGGAEAEVPPADGHRRGAGRVLDERAGLRLRRRRDHHQGDRGPDGSTDDGRRTRSPARRCG